MQYYDSGWFSRAFVLVLIGFVLLNIARARRRDVFLRRIPGLNAIDDAIGRATEMGRPVLMIPGIGDVGQVGITAQALVIFSYIVKKIARFATPMRLFLAYAPAYTLAQEMMRSAYAEEGQADNYNPDSVQFLTDQQFAFAAGVSGIIHREKPAACFFLGAFYAESLIFAETANRTGAIQVAGSTQNTQTPFFIAACDYVLIADEFYAASAYLGREPVLVGSLTGQDWSKILIVAMMIFFVGYTSVQMRQTIPYTRAADGRWIKTPEHMRVAKETLAYYFFNPAQLVRGSPNLKQYASLPDYMRQRKAELGVQSDATVVEEGAVEELPGKWYRWEVKDGDFTRYVEDFVVERPDGIKVIRQYRSRLKRPPEKAPSAGGTA